MSTVARIAIVALGTLAVAACGPGEPPEPEAQRYELSGEVVSANAEAGTVTIDHEPVGDYMGAMTMPFNIRDDWVFDVAEPGATIRATLVVQGMESWLEDVVVRKGASAGAAAAVVVPQPHPGDVVPSIELIDQAGATLTLDAYAGDYYAYTFIYTRCPLPDFCPRMSEHFDDVYEAVAADPERYADLKLLSLSIDPDYDTPEVLREYGQRYLEDDAPAGFERWRFATSRPEGLFEIGTFSGLRFMPDGEELIHSLRTVLVDPQGQVVQTFIGNEWQPADLLEALEAARAGS